MADDGDDNPAADEDLIARIAAARDRAAFAELFRRHAGRVKAFLINAGAAPDEADDAAQEVMASVWRRADSFEPARAGAVTWIYAIARNRRIDMVRRGRRPEPDPHDPLFRPEPPPAAAEVLAARDRDAVVRRTLAALSPEQRAVVRMAFYQGLTHAEIAARLDAPLGTVKSRLRLAMDRLRAALGGEFADELSDE